MTLVTLVASYKNMLEWVSDSHAGLAEAGWSGEQGGACGGRTASGGGHSLPQAPCQQLYQSPRLGCRAELCACDGSRLSNGGRGTGSRARGQ